VGRVRFVEASRDVVRAVRQAEGVGSASGKTLCFLHHLEGYNIFLEKHLQNKNIIFKQERAFNGKKKLSQ
jgi:hypothetical protein